MDPTLEPKAQAMRRADPSHPGLEALERLMRGELPRPEAAMLVRHLLTGCPCCLEVSGRLWRLGEPGAAEENLDSEAAENQSGWGYRRAGAVWT